MFELNITFGQFAAGSMKINSLVIAMPENIRIGMTKIGLLLKAQIQQNLSGPPHTKYHYWDLGSRSQQAAAAAQGIHFGRLLSTTKVRRGDRYYGAEVQNPFPGRLTGALMGSVSSHVDSDGLAVRVGPSMIYSAIHEFGGWAGRKLAAFIPARPYVWPAFLTRRLEILEVARVEFFRGAL